MHDGTVGNISKLSSNSVTLRARIEFPSGNWDIYSLDSVKTIRYKRHGSKETRDIVAMLGREYRTLMINVGKDILKKEYYFKYSKNPMQSDYGRAFYKAKSMLK
jgi:hypothetical protein